MGNNILTDSGIAGAEYAYDDGKRISEEYIDIEGDPTENNDGICKKKFFYENDTCKTLFFDKEDKSKEYNLTEPSSFPRL